MPRSYDVLYPKTDPRNPHNTIWLKIGAAFEKEGSDTGQLDIRLELMPIDDDGRPFFPRKLNVFLKHPKKKTTTDEE